MRAKSFTFFQFFTFAVFFVFMAVMTVVTITAYSRRSGSTGLNMVKIQQMRFEVSAKAQENEESAKKNFR